MLRASGVNANFEFEESSERYFNNSSAAFPS